MSFFITGTDTGVGKTVVTACLAALAQEQGLSVCVYKPVQTGCTDAALPDDPGQIIDWLGQPVAWANTYRFPEPVAPLVADTAGIIRTEAILAHFLELAEAYDVVLVEGAGGVRVPLTPGCDMRGLASLLGLPVMIVARPDLGTINHTLMTVESLQSQNLPVAGVIVSNYPADSADPAIQSLPEIFCQLLPVPVLAYLPPLRLSSGFLRPECPELEPLRKRISVLKKPHFSLLI